MRKAGVALLALVAITATLSIASHFRVKESKAAEEALVATALARGEFTPDELREDIVALRTWLKYVHPAEIPSFPLGDIDSALHVVDSGLDEPLDHLGFYRRIAPVVNGLNDEHVMVFPPDRSDEASSFPFDVSIKNHRIFVSREWRADTGVDRGDELLSINGIAAASIVDSISSFYSGTTTLQKQEYAAWDFASALPQVLDVRPPFELGIRRAGAGAVSKLEVPPVDRTNVPRPEFSAFSYESAEPKAMRITINAFHDKENRFDEFLENTFDAVRERSIDTLIIDLRRNQGGASELGDRILVYLTDRPFTQLKSVDVRVSGLVKQEFIGYVPGFLRWLPIQYLHPFLKPMWTSEIGDVASVSFDPISPARNPLRFDGDVYVLIGPGTMSSASLFAATIKHYRLGTLIGEQTGGYATMYGNVVDARLPNTGLKVWMPTSVVYGHGEGPVMPDYEVRETIADIADSRDAVLEFAIELAAGNRR